MNHNMPPAAPGYDPYANPAYAQGGYPNQLPAGWESPVSSVSGWGGATAGEWAGTGAAMQHDTLSYYSQPNSYGNTAPGWGTSAPNTSPTAWGGNTAPNNAGWNGNAVASGYGGEYVTGNMAPGRSPVMAPVGGRGRLGNALAATKEGFSRLFNRNESIRHSTSHVGSTAIRGIMGRAANAFRTKTTEARAAWTPERQERARSVAQSVGRVAARAAVEFGNEFGQEYGFKLENGRVSVDKWKLGKEAVKFAVLPNRKATAAVRATRAIRNTAKTMASENRYTQAAFAGAESGGWRGAVRGAVGEAGQHAQQYVQEQGGVSQAASNFVSMAAARYEGYGSAMRPTANNYVGYQTPQGPNQYPGQAYQPGVVLPPLEQQAHSAGSYSLAA